MHRIKAIFISLFITILVMVFVLSAWKWSHGPALSPWIGTLLASAVPLSFFGRLFLWPLARTTSNMHWMYASGMASSILSAILGGGIGPPAQLALTVGVLLPLVYIYWYSRFEQRGALIVAVGRQLPDLLFIDTNGHHLTTTDLTKRTALWLFYRGNWCPFCMAQIKEIAAQYRALAERGVDVLLISSQPQEHTRELAKSFDVPMRFLTDPDNLAAAQLGILVEGGLPMGMQMFGYDPDVPLPTVLITAPGGRIVYNDLTDNYRVRPEPEEFLKALTAAGL